MGHGPMTPEQADAYKKYLEKMREEFTVGVNMLDHEDKLYILDKIDEARWVTGPTYNQGVHILMNMLQYAVEAYYQAPNVGSKKRCVDE